MVKFHDGQFLLSPTDITAAAGCEYGWLAHAVDPKLGRRDLVVEEDAFLEKVSSLGDAHEARTVGALRAELGEENVVELARPTTYTPDRIAEAVEATVAELRAGRRVVCQGMLHDGAFGGLTDFLVRHEDGSYLVADTKLARHARVTALLQIAAYADLLDRLEIPRTPHGELWLGDGTRHRVDLDEIIPVYRHQRARLESLLRHHVDSGRPAAWGDDRLSVCGRCDACAEAIAEHEDFLQIAGATGLQRTRARAGGYASIHDVAAAETGPATVTERTWSRLHAQARLQTSEAGEDGLPPVEIVDASALHGLPAPDAGDMFFDFEGDPLWMGEDGMMGSLEYLWGWAEAPEGRTTADTAFGDFTFTPLWADSRAEERAALERFVALVEARRAAHPDMHIYHYAPYEVTALKRLTVTHRHGEAELDTWLHAGLFVDLYSTVRAGLRIGVPSYSIKKLEPLYMGADHRDDDGVTTAADSVTEYHRYVALKDAGETGDAGAAAEARRIRGSITEYNAYDCISTARLRDWLLALAAEHPAPLPEHEDPDAAEEKAAEDKWWTPVEEALLRMLPTRVDAETGQPVPEEDLDPEQAGLALLSASPGFFDRERKPLWWAFFERLLSPVDEWPEPRTNLVADRVEILEDWHRPPRARTDQRVLRLVGVLEPGTDFAVGKKTKTVYEDIPEGAVLSAHALRWAGPNAEVEEIEDFPDGRSAVTLREKTKAGGHAELPMAAFLHDKITTDSLEQRIGEHAQSTLDAGRLPTHDDAARLGLFPAVFDVLARRTPPTVGRPLAEITAEARSDSEATRRQDWEALVEALESARGSYVAVQGPPGTGKTHTGSHAVKALLEKGWSVGITAQSHAVVENFLDKLAELGVPKNQLTKASSRSRKEDPDAPWAWSGSDHEAQPMGTPGVAFGGTAWAFANKDAVPVDLMVIDEAGQFSLAHTLAAAAQARTLLLLGDPQQLPQVSQGTHPQPVDQAALGWLMRDHAGVLPTELGFFLDTSWRMHSALTAPVSTLAYGGELGAKEDVTDTRTLEGIAPGLHAVPVEHTGNALTSTEEAAEVVRLVGEAVGRTWTKDPDAAPGTEDGPRPLTDQDVIVITPYNAQVATIRRALDVAGFHGTTVGTVDRFQGREAAIAIVSMAASSAEDVPRGLDFLLSTNRLNVSISRGQWAAYLVYSPALCDVLPTNPADLPLVGRFLRLVDAG